MTIYLFLVIEILILNFLRKNHNISDKSFTVIMCASFVLITGLRARSVGSDTWNYHDSFYANAYYTLPQIITMGKRDFGFFIIQWVISNFFHHFTVLTLVAAIVYYVPTSLFIYERSSDMGLSYLVLMAFTFFQFSMTGIRQTMAFGFAVLFIREIWRDKPRYIWAFLFLIIGITMHKSCVVVLLFLILKKMNNIKSIAVWGLMVTPVVFFLRGPIVATVLNFIGEHGFDNYTSYVSGGGITTYIVFILLLIWGLYFTYQERDGYVDGLPNQYLIVFSVATMLQGLVYENSILFRAVWYFSIILVIYIPELIRTVRVGGRDISLVNFVVYACILYMYFGITIGSANVLPYRFFFQG